MLVSAIIPTHNRAATLARAIDSALAQSHAPLEVIVVDDGSTDGTRDLLATYSGRIHALHQANAGPSAARNRGAAAARGGILAFLDSDDLWLPDKLARQVALMERAGPAVDCCVCDAAIASSPTPTARTAFRSAALAPPFAEGIWHNPAEVLATRFLLFNQVAAIRRGAFEDCGGFNEALRLLEDYELALRLAHRGPWGVIRDPLTLKHNDTDGIGVRCMNDREQHLRARTAVVGHLLGSGTLAEGRATAHLGRELALLHDEARAISLARRGGLAVTAGNVLTLRARIRRALFRRSRAWPVFHGTPL